MVQCDRQEVETLLGIGVEPAGLCPYWKRPGRNVVCWAIGIISIGIILIVLVNKVKNPTYRPEKIMFYLLYKPL